MNTIGEKIDLDNAVCREFDIIELHRIIAGSGYYRMSWAFNNPKITVKDKAYRFTVSGHHHKGHVHIILNGLDLFDIYYTSNQGTIRKIDEGIYNEDLIDVLDRAIERIPDYVK